jgi:uncharacterized membrane protein
MTTGSSIPTQTDAARKATRRNIEAVAKLEEDFNRSRSRADRIADRVGGFSGSVAFVLLHALIFTAWIALNLGVVPGFRKFDPFPFMLLSVAVSLEAIFLSTFVLMKQTRMSKRADQRAHLDLQINLLAEREMTLVLQMLQRISTRLGVRPAGEEIEELSEETSLESLASQIQESLPEE